MKVEYDKEVDSLYIRIQEKNVARTQEVSDGVNLDINNQDRLIGLEVVGASKRYASADIFNLSTENLILPRKGVFSGQFFDRPAPMARRRIRP